MATLASEGWTFEQWRVNVGQREEEEEWTISIPEKKEENRRILKLLHE